MKAMQTVRARRKPCSQCRYDRSAANPRLAGSHQAGTEIGASDGGIGPWPHGNYINGFAGGEATGTSYVRASTTGTAGSNTIKGYRLRPDNTAVAPVVLI